MNTTTTTAAAEAAKNLAIYNAVADHARHAFEYLNIKPGQYTPAQIVAELKNSRADWKDNAPAVGDEGGLVRVAVDAFACQFPLLSAFEVLAQVTGICLSFGKFSDEHGNYYGENRDTLNFDYTEADDCRHHFAIIE